MAITPRSQQKNMSKLAKPLIDAYRATQYRVLSDANAGSGFRLRLDSFSTDLMGAFVAHGVTGAALITAFNPRSEQFADAVNLARHRDWLATLDAAGFVHLPAENVDPSGAWPTELSRLVLGISQAEAEAMARSLDQNGLVFAGSDAVPRLILLR